MTRSTFEDQVQRNPTLPQVQTAALALQSQHHLELRSSIQKSISFAGLSCESQWVLHAGCEKEERLTVIRVDRERVTRDSFVSVWFPSGNLADETRSRAMSGPQPDAAGSLDPCTDAGKYISWLEEAAGQARTQPCRASLHLKQYKAAQRRGEDRLVLLRKAGSSST